MGGLDISDVELVVNYDMPLNIDDYVHRIGRTGRAGKKGISFSLVTPIDARIARKLIDVLSEAKQQIPNELRQMREMKGGNRSGGRGWGKPGWNSGRSYMQNGDRFGSNGGSFRRF